MINLTYRAYQFDVKEMLIWVEQIEYKKRIIKLKHKITLSVYVELIDLLNFRWQNQYSFSFYICILIQWGKNLNYFIIRMLGKSKKFIVVS